MFTLFQGIVDEGEQDEAAENRIQLVVPRENAAKSFQPPEQPLHFVPPFVQFPVYSQGSFRLRNGGTTGSYPNSIANPRVALPS